jgi:hypothetical protein
VRRNFRCPYHSWTYGVSATTSPRIGSSWSRTSWIATTARASTRNWWPCCRSSPKGYAAQYFVGHEAEFAPEARGFTVDGSDGFGRLAYVTEEQDRRYYAATVRPQVFLNLVPDHVIAHRMFPFAADRRGHDLSRSVELFHRVNEQDFAACERCQPSMSSRSYAGAECSSPPSSTSPACTNRCAAGSLTTTEPGTSGLKARADPGARPGTRVRRRSQ